MGQTTRRIGKGISWAFKIFMLIAVFISIMSVLNYTGVLSGQNQTVNNIWDQAVSFFSGGIDATKQLVKTGVNKTSEQLEGLPQIETPNITLPVLSETDNTENNKITQTNIGNQKTLDQCPNCFSGTVTRIVDGDTIHVDGQSIRLSLVNTPERGEYKYKEATDYTKSQCPVGSTAFVDIDDGQKASYERPIAKIYCNGGQGEYTNLNAELAEQNYIKGAARFCHVSEFSKESWASKTC